jgi:beta-glucanase (GH16 family)
MKIYNAILLLFLLTLIIIPIKTTGQPNLLLSSTSCGKKVSDDPEPYNMEGDWIMVEELSDEFETDEVDIQKWDNDVSDWGVWSWEPENAYQKDGNLHIRMVYDPHERNNEQLFYKSGIIRSVEPITYGFFEAKIKGCPRFPGVCPAFWMIGSKDGLSSEIDFMEIQEVQNDIHQIDCNLHARIKENGEFICFRERRHWVAPWDPRDDFHLYACENTPDSIHWYIDGQKVLSAPNTHFHLPMYVIVSMGVRTPLLYYDTPDPEHPESKRRYADAENSTPEGFPTEMIVDYVRVWKRK